MNNPVFGFCDAGCRYRVPTYYEFVNSASYTEVEVSGGTCNLRYNQKYKIFPKSGSQTISFLVKTRIDPSDYEVEILTLDATEKGVVFCAGSASFWAESYAVDMEYRYSTLLDEEKKKAHVAVEENLEGLPLELYVINVEKVYLYNEEAEIVVRGEDGKSAYNVAVDNGFEGTEAEWLASLGSSNAVCGSDVANIVEHGYRDVSVEWMTGGISANGTDKDAETAGVRSTRYIELEDNCTLEVKCDNINIALYIAEYDADKNHIVRQTGYNSLTTSKERCSFVRFALYSETFSPDEQPSHVTVRFIYDNTTADDIRGYMNEKVSKAYLAEGLSKGKNIIYPEWSVGNIASNGIDTNATTGIKSDFIPVFKDATVKFSSATNSGLSVFMSEYDAEKNFLVRSAETKYPSWLSPTREDCAFVRLSTWHATFSAEEAENECVVFYEYDQKKPKERYAFDHIGIKSINHSGYNWVAPENTLPAYRLSKQKAFDFVECDIGLTSDKVPVLLHDDTINRTARNADGSAISGDVNINSITYEQALAYDFGAWRGATYVGTKIPTLDEFIALCKKLGLFAYIELKSSTTYTKEDIENIVSIARKYGMERSVSYISFNEDALSLVSQVDEGARLGFVSAGTTEARLKVVLRKCKTQTNSIFFDCRVDMLTTDICDFCEKYGVSVEVYSPNTEAEILALDDRVSGVTSDKLVAKDVFYNANIGATDTGIV